MQPPKFSTGDPLEKILLRLMGRKEDLQERIAALCGTTDIMVRFWMLGHRFPSWDQAVILARELDEPLILDAFEHPAEPIEDGEHISDSSLEINVI